MLAGLADNVNEIGSVHSSRLVSPSLLMSIIELVWVYALRLVVSETKVHLCICSLLPVIKRSCDLHR